MSAEDTVPDIGTQSGGGNCGCDRRTTADCNTITVFGDGFVESGTLSCFYEFTKVTLPMTSYQVLPLITINHDLSIFLYGCQSCEFKPRS